jgi:phosphohistidine phosphatase
MELYLLRHGRAAGAPQAAGSDSDRVLTAEGIAGLEHVLDLARRTRVCPSLILSSPFARAVQTAEIAARALGCSREILRSPNFAPDSSPYRAWEEIRLYEDEPSVLVAAHEPLLSSTVAWLAGSTRVMIRFLPATMVRIDFEALGPHPDGIIKWMISPELG